MNKKDFDASVQIVELSSLENRFAFIDNQILRQNLTVCFQYIIFLLSLEDTYHSPGAIQYSIFKNIILHTASIAEAITSHKLQLLLKDGRVKAEEIFPHDYKYQCISELHKISPTETICGVKRTKIYPRLNNETTMVHLNKTARTVGLFTQAVFEKAEKLRTLRNKIHLAGLDEADDNYSKTDVEECFTATKLIIERVQKFA